MSPVPVSDEVRHCLEDDLLLFYTGVRRPASEVLAYQQVSDHPSSVSLEANLDAVRDLGYRTHDALVDGDLARFGALLSEQWQLKFDRSPTAIHRTVDDWIQTGVAAGALGGKLVGAGGGGFLLFYAEDKARLRSAMSDLGLHEVRFGFDYMGSTTLVDS